MFSPGQQALRLGYLVGVLMLDDEEEAAELCTLYQLPVERQGGESVAIINKVRLLHGQPDTVHTLLVRAVPDVQSDAASRVGAQHTLLRAELTS